MYAIYIVSMLSLFILRQFFFLTGVSLARQAQKDAKEAADRSEEAALMLMIWLIYDYHFIGYYRVGPPR